MNRTGTILLAIALVTVLAAAPLGAAGAFATDGGETGDATEGSIDSTEETDDASEPGARLAGVVGVQDAEIDGEVAERAYGVKVANARTDAAKADVVDDQLEAVETRLAAHEADLEALAEAREAGEIGDGEYRAKVARVAAERATTERMATQTAATADELPEDVLEERGIDVDAIRELRDRASELGGPETAEIARSVAGESVGYGVADERGPGSPIPDYADNGTPTDGVDADNETSTDAADAGNETPTDRTDAGNETSTDRTDATDESA